MAENEKLPEGLEARFEPTREGPPRKQDIPAGLAACAISSSGDWRCRLPAGRLDIALHPKGFVPHYLWNLGVTAGETSRLAALKLQRGASVAGWITREHGTPAKKCRVRLEPAVAPGGRPSDPILDFLRKVAAEAPCQKKGFFQFSAVKSGPYAIVVEESDARAQMSPVEVWEGAETRITQPIVLRRPVDFEVTLSPPTDWLGRPWRLEARRASEYRAAWEEASFRAEASPDGRVRLSKQLPGRFWIMVYDQLGNSMFSDRYVDLADPAQPYPITIDLLWVEGTLHLGDEPVAGRLFFGGRSGVTSVEMHSDAEGRFDGPLPKTGGWYVDIEGSEPRLKTSVRVEVEPKDHRATVTIDLPDTRVYGRVIDPAGTPASNADVVLGSKISTFNVKADGKGEFEIRAFPEGTTELSAELGRESSEAYVFDASGESPHGPVVLTLRRNRAIRGRVLAATGPVVGATVKVWPAAGGVVSTLRSGLDGSFELKVPADTQAVQAIVGPPGGALKAREVSVANDAELMLPVEPLGGEVIVDLGKREVLDTGVLLLWQDEIRIPFGTLVGWAEGHGVRFVQGSQVRIPQLAPGHYTVCVGAPEVATPGGLEAWKNRSKCAAGFLSPASVLDLRLP